MRSARASTWWSMALDMGTYPARWVAGVASRSERQLLMTKSLQESPSWRSVICLMRRRSRLDLPDSLSPKTRKKGSWSKLTWTGSRLFSSREGDAAVRLRKGCGQVGERHVARQESDCGAPGVVQWRATSRLMAAVASERSLSEWMPSMRGTAAMKCSASGVTPRQEPQNMGSRIGTGRGRVVGGDGDRFALTARRARGPNLTSPQPAELHGLISQDWELPQPHLPR